MKTLHNPSTRNNQYSQLAFCLFFQVFFFAHLFFVFFFTKIGLCLIIGNFFHLTRELDTSAYSTTSFLFTATYLSCAGSVSDFEGLFWRRDDRWTWDKKFDNHCWVPKQHHSVHFPLQSYHNLFTWNDKIKINVVKSYKKTLKLSYLGVIAR